MSHPTRWIALLLAFTSVAGIAATVESPPATIAPVIRAPGTSTSAAATPDPATPGPAAPSAPSPGTPAHGAGATAPIPTEGPSLSGDWQATEVIVFDRPTVGLEPKGELLLSDAPRRFPARLQSFEPAGVGGSVIYPAGPDARMCLAASSGTAGPGTVPGVGAPEAFAKPPRAASPREHSGTTADTADRSATAGAEAGTGGAQPDGAVQPEPADPRAELERALREYEAGLETQSLAWLPTGANPLAAQARRLVDGGGYRILFHRTWIQNLAQRGAAPPILIQSDRNSADPESAASAELEGTVQLSRNRGLRFAATLWYRPADTDPADPRYIGMDEVIELGDGQIHYIDHPKLGIIVRTTAVGVPASIGEAWATLSPPVE